MPELPEVETTRLGIIPWVEGQQITDVIVYNGNLRWPVSASLKKGIKAQVVEKIVRRGKYLLGYTQNGCLIIHLGMTGGLRVVRNGIPATKHDHLDLLMGSGNILRYRDARRFGSVLWTTRDPLRHKLLKALGPEPFSEDFNDSFLYQKSRHISRPVKNFIMDSRIVAGLGNIYANESLFAAGIIPRRKAGNISVRRYAKLVTVIKAILRRSIQQGGTTLRDFANDQGRPGYFQQQLQVYGREKQPCVQCHNPIRRIKLSQRATFYCANCQT